MFINYEDKKTTANKLAKETIGFSVSLWLDHIFGSGLLDQDEDGNWFHDWDNLDNELIKDMFHWISIEDEQLEAMTKKEKKQFVLAMEKHLRRTQKFLGVE